MLGNTYGSGARRSRAAGRADTGHSSPAHRRVPLTSGRCRPGVPRLQSQPVKGSETSSADDGRISWGVRRLTHALLYVSMAVSGVWSWYWVRASNEVDQLSYGVGLALATVIPVALFAGIVYRCRLRVDGRGVEIVRLISCTLIPWPDVVRAEPSYFGIRIWRLNGSSVVAPVVQKSNLAKMLSIRTRADDVADCINQRVRLHDANLRADHRP